MAPQFSATDQFGKLAELLDSVPIYESNSRQVQPHIGDIAILGFRQPVRRHAIAVTRTRDLVTC
jgi:hypothetical protein